VLRHLEAHAVTRLIGCVLAILSSFDEDNAALGRLALSRDTFLRWQRLLTRLFKRRLVIGLKRRRKASSRLLL